MIVSGWVWDYVVPDSLGCTESSEPKIALCFGSGKNSSAVYLPFECFCWFAGIVFGASHPNFFCILANGTIWSPSASLWFCAVALEVS